MFCRDMGLWKTSTDATMTMTRFRQLPIECVTGDTRWRIMYDTCIYVGMWPAYDGTIEWQTVRRLQEHLE